MPTSKPIHAAFIIYDRVLFSGITRPCELLSAVNTMGRLDRESDLLTLDLVRVAPEQPQVVADLPIQVAGELSTQGKIDWLFIPPSWRHPAFILKKYPQLLDQLRQRHAEGTTLIATGAGVYFLAQAGLLDGLPATTHWYFFENFEKRYPEIELKQQHFITYANNIYCTGSINALSDLVFYLIGQSFGLERRQMAERHFAHEVGTSYDLPMFSVGSAVHTDEAIISVQEWLRANWHLDVDVIQMAQKAGMPVRTFTRRFRSALGITPNQYLQDLRTENARDMLKTTDLSISDVAECVGYKDTAYFARLFKSRIGLTPTEYKRVVRPKLFQVSSGDDGTRDAKSQA